MDYSALLTPHHNELAGSPSYSLLRLLRAPPPPPPPPLLPASLPSFPPSIPSLSSSPGSISPLHSKASSSCLVSHFGLRLLVKVYDCDYRILPAPPMRLLKHCHSLGDTLLCISSVFTGKREKWR
ncbi:hypothetical protein E2C01_081847 [Portunus trituberculatus]|uniref:Uncharacterized protein n=1 Tax=Portunus trituberculatus TaxID=210409 RepID=A0A5B7IXJ3_PORTR|nr:hypothetical protein [Portunus trituberculatus]